jgi:hypothetical protein
MWLKTEKDFSTFPELYTAKHLFDTCIAWNYARNCDWEDIQYKWFEAVLGLDEFGDIDEIEIYQIRNNLQLSKIENIFNEELI